MSVTRNRKAAIMCVTRYIEGAEFVSHCKPPTKSWFFPEMVISEERPPVAHFHPLQIESVGNTQGPQDIPSVFMICQTLKEEKKRRPYFRSDLIFGLNWFLSFSAFFTTCPSFSLFKSGYTSFPSLLNNVVWKIPATLWPDGLPTKTSFPFENSPSHPIYYSCLDHFLRGCCRTK